MKRKSPGLFTGWWLDMDGNRIERIWGVEEWAEIYRLHDLGEKLGLYRPNEQIASKNGLRSLAREASPQSSDVAVEDGPEKLPGWPESDLRD